MKGEGLDQLTPENWDVFLEKMNEVKLSQQTTTSKELPLSPTEKKDEMSRKEPIDLAAIEQIGKEINSPVELDVAGIYKAYPESESESEIKMNRKEPIDLARIEQKIPQIEEQNTKGEKKSNLSKLRNLFKRTKKSKPLKTQSLLKEHKKQTKSLLDQLSAFAPEKNPRSSIGAKGTDGLFNEKRGANKKRKKTNLRRNKNGIKA